MGRIRKFFFKKPKEHCNAYPKRLALRLKFICLALYSSFVPNVVGKCLYNFIAHMEGLHIMNKSGGLIYTTDKQAEDNALMVIASSIQSLNEITRNSLSTDYFYQAVEYETIKMHIFRTATGFTFIFITSERNHNPVLIYRRVYRHFCEVVLADPFYCLEMPITNPSFRPERYLGFDIKPRCIQNSLSLPSANQKTS